MNTKGVQMEIIREKINHWECVILQGPFIVSNTEDVLNIINEVKEYHDKYLVIDLTNVPFMDSSAIGVLFAGCKELAKLGGELVIYGANEVISDVFKAVQLTNHISVFLNRGDFMHQRIHD